MRAAPVAALACAGMVVACSGSSSPGGTARASPPHVSGTATPTPEGIGGVRTVLSPLGLNIHADASRSAPLVGVAAQGALLTVVDYRSSDGGWYKVQGQTVTGWIVADATLSAAGQLTSYQSQRGFSTLYPVNWTFAEEPADTLFRPQQGSMESIVVRTGASTGDFGSAPQGYVQTYENDALVVCGYTGRLLEYQLGSGVSTPAPPSGSTAAPQARYADIRMRLDASHALELAFNYTSDSDLRVFEDFYNSITFNFPQCEAPASAAPSPT